MLDNLVDKRLALEQAVQWRIKVYGMACLTPRELQAVELDYAFRCGATGLAHTYLRELQHRFMVARSHDRVCAMIALSDQAHAEAARIRQQERGIQKAVAAAMGVTEGRVSQLLSSATRVVTYLVMRDPDSYGWRTDAAGDVFLAVPVAGIHAITRRKHE